MRRGGGKFKRPMKGTAASAASRPYETPKLIDLEPFVVRAGSLSPSPTAVEAMHLFGAWCRFHNGHAARKSVEWCGLLLRKRVLFEVGPFKVVPRFVLFLGNHLRKMAEIFSDRELTALAEGKAPERHRFERAKNSRNVRARTKARTRGRRLVEWATEDRDIEPALLFLAPEPVDHDPCGVMSGTWQGQEAKALAILGVFEAAKEARRQKRTAQGSGRA